MRLVAKLKRTFTRTTQSLSLVIQGNRALKEDFLSSLFLPSTSKGKKSLLSTYTAAQTLACSVSQLGPRSLASLILMLSSSVVTLSSQTMHHFFIKNYINLDLWILKMHVSHFTDSLILILKKCTERYH